MTKRTLALGALIVLSCSLGCREQPELQSNADALAACFPTLRPRSNESISRFIARLGLKRVDSIDVARQAGPWLVVRPGGSFLVLTAVYAGPSTSGPIAQAILDGTTPVLQPLNRCVSDDDETYCDLGSSGEWSGPDIRISPSTFGSIVDVTESVETDDSDKASVEFDISLATGMRILDVMPSCSCIDFELHQEGDDHRLTYLPTSHVGHARFAIQVETKTGIQHTTLHCFRSPLVLAQAIPAEIRFRDLNTEPSQSAQLIELEPGTLQLEDIECSHPAISVSVTDSLLTAAVDPSKVIPSRDLYEESITIPLRSLEPLVIPVSISRPSRIRIPTVLDLGHAKEGVFQKLIECPTDQGIFVSGVTSPPGTSISIVSQQDDLTMLKVAVSDNVQESILKGTVKFFSPTQSVLAKDTVKFLLDQKGAEE